MSIFDVCVIGHVTRDRSNFSPEPRPGGTAYYSALALRRLGRRVAVLTRIAPADRDELLAEMLDAGIHVRALDGSATTAFDNTYDEADPNRRTQRVLSLAEGFGADDLGDLRARAFHLGPLTRFDMDAAFVEAVAERGPVFLDAQGLVREIDQGAIRICPCADAPRILSQLECIKADEVEARILTREHRSDNAALALVYLGARAALVTHGSEGSAVATESEVQPVDALPPRELRDPTGCGDTYAAAALHRWLDGERIHDAARFAAVAATMALERVGAFDSSESEVEQRMAGA